MYHSIKIFFTSICLFYFLIFSNLESAAPHQEEWEFNITEVSSTQFNITTATAVSLGYIQSNGLQYQYFDISKQLNSQFQLQPNEWSSCGNVVDIYGTVVGKLKGKLQYFCPLFEIYSADDQLLALASFNLWMSQAEIRDPATNELIASANRPFYQLGFDWTLNIENLHLFQQKEIDIRVLFFLMAVQSQGITSQPR